MSARTFGLGFGGFAIMAFIMLIVAVLVAVGIIFLVRYLSNSNRNGVQYYSSNALNILNERYARGEINDEEYQRMKSQLMK